MDKDTILQISYEDLYALLVSVQDDALAADGCSYDCTADLQGWIRDEIDNGTITIVKK